MKVYPSNYVIAVALYAAAREQNGDPGEIALAAASGAQDVGNGQTAPRPYNRTRSYACIALRKAFPSVPKIWMGRAVGVRSVTDVWVSKLIRDSMHHRYRKWWSPAALDRVSAAVAWAIDREAAPIILPPAVLPRPAVSSRQRAALRLLEEAMRNTQRSAEA
jgi:hypothetical protein